MGAYRDALGRYYQDRRRDRRILQMFDSGVARKMIAYRLRSNYEIVKKVIQKMRRPVVEDRAIVINL